MSLRFKNNHQIFVITFFLYVQCTLKNINLKRKRKGTKYTFTFKSGFFFTLNRTCLFVQYGYGHILKIVSFITFDRAIVKDKLDIKHNLDYMCS